MKIVYFFTELGLTGGPMIHYNYMNGLHKKGHTIYVVTMHEAFVWHHDAYKDYIKLAKTPRKGLFKAAEMIYGATRARLIKSNFSTTELIEKITDLLIHHYHDLNITPDILFATHTFTADAAYKVRQKEKLVIYDMHFEELLFENSISRAEVSKLTNLPFQHLALSTWLKNMLRYQYNISATLMVPGIDQKVFHKPLNPAKYAKPEKTILITYCDPTRKFKAFPQQMEILEQLTKIHPKLVIQLYGHDPKTTAFPYQFLGWVSQQKLANFYADAHLLLMPSWYESFPQPPIEAMAAGCCAAAGQFGTEDYLEDQKTGIVINPFNIAKSVKKLSELIDNPHKMLTLARNGQQKSQTFVWDDQIEKMHTFLTELPEPRLLDIAQIQTGQFSEFNKLQEL